MGKERSLMRGVVQQLNSQHLLDLDYLRGEEDREVKDIAESFNRFEEQVQ